MPSSPCRCTSASFSRSSGSVRPEFAGAEVAEDPTSRPQRIVTYDRTGETDLSRSSGCRGLSLTCRTSGGMALQSAHTGNELMIH